MSGPTVVYVGRPCRQCEATGILAGGAVRCFRCHGVKFTHEPMPIEDFAKLFEPVTVTDSRTYERKVLRVKP